MLLRAQDATRLGEGLRRGTIDYDRGAVTSTPFDGEPTMADYAQSTIFGNPDDVRALRDETGMQQINIMTDFAGCDFATARPSIELFGREVLPGLREDQV